jgi:hypothetical protein
LRDAPLARAEAWTAGTLPENATGGALEDELLLIEEETAVPTAAIAVIEQETYVPMVLATAPSPTVVIPSIDDDSSPLPLVEKLLNSDARRMELRAAKQLAYRLALEATKESQQDTEMICEAVVQSIIPALPQGASGSELAVPLPAPHATQETRLGSSQQAGSLSHDSSPLPLAEDFVNNAFARRKESRAAKQLAYRLAQEAATENQQDTELNCEAEVQTDAPVQETPHQMASSLQQAAASSSRKAKSNKRIRAKKRILKHAALGTSGGDLDEQQSALPSLLSDQGRHPEEEEPLASSLQLTAASSSVKKKPNSSVRTKQRKKEHAALRALQASTEDQAKTEQERVAEVLVEPRSGSVEGSFIQGCCDGQPDNPRDAHCASPTSSMAPILLSANRGPIVIGSRPCQESTVISPHTPRRKNWKRPRRRGHRQQPTEP